MLLDRSGVGEEVEEGVGVLGGSRGAGEEEVEVPQAAQHLAEARREREMK
jgi:hypothetical protein